MRTWTLAVLMATLVGISGAALADPIGLAEHAVVYQVSHAKDTAGLNGLSNAATGLAGSAGTTAGNLARDPAGTATGAAGTAQNVAEAAAQAPLAIANQLAGGALAQAQAAAIGAVGTATATAANAQQTAANTVNGAFPTVQRWETLANNVLNQHRGVPRP